MKDFFPEDDEISRRARAESRRFVVFIALFGALAGLLCGLYVKTPPMGQMMILGGTFWAIGFLGLAVFL